MFTITGRGTVATGRIERGKVKLQDGVEIIGYNKTLKSTVTGIEMFKQMMDYGEAGDQVGILLRGVKRDEIRRGMAITAPKSASMHNYFKAQVSAWFPQSIYSFLQPQTREFFVSIRFTCSPRRKAAVKSPSLTTSSCKSSASRGIAPRSFSLRVVKNCSCPVKTLASDFTCKRKW